MKKFNICTHKLFLYKIEKKVLVNIKDMTEANLIKQILDY